MHRSVLILGSVALSALAACGASQSTCLPLCGGDRSYDAKSYDLHATIDWSTFDMVANERITVELAVSNVIELDARVAISAIHTVDGDDLPFVVDNDVDGNPLHVRVDLNSIAQDGPVTFVVLYSASPSDTLRVGGPRDDDPNTGTVVFTDSEPDRVPKWMVVKDDPADRALWSVEVSAPGDRDLLANGVRVIDERVGENHRVRYEMDKPLPTYLMAFATGDLVHEDATLAGHVPFQLWHRTGLPVNPQTTFDDVNVAMTVFERLVGPYPWDSYAVFLAPGYGGGMENATITFNAEASGLGNGSFILNAHELAHHWFGDWVTMNRYEDVWVKEGMATLLESEADRARRDKAGTGRLFGHDMSFSPDDAIVDNELSSLDRYTSGPYQRASWTITQIRAIVGETAFWAGLRKVLADHALDSVTGEQFIRTFPLTEPQVQQLLGALTTKMSPTIGVSAAGSDLTFTVTDPGGTLLAPIGLTAVDAAGAATTKTLAPGAPVTLTIPAGGYLAADEADVHPYWPSSFVVGETDYGNVLAHELPGDPPAITAFGMRSSATQELAIADAGLPTTTPAGIVALYNAVDSLDAQRSILIAACGVLKGLSGTEATAMQQALAPLVMTPARPQFNASYALCGTVLPAQTIAGEFATLSTTVTAATAGRLDYLLSFDYGPQAFGTLSLIAKNAPTLALRDRAITRLGLQTVGRYSAIPAADKPAWAAFFRDRLGHVTSQTRFLNVWRGVLGLADAMALPIAAPLLHKVPMSPFVQRQIVCDAFRIAGSPAAFAAFQSAAQPANTLSTEAQAVLADPAQCNAQRRAAVPARLRGKAALEALLLDR